MAPGAVHPEKQIIMIVKNNSAIEVFMDILCEGVRSIRNELSMYRGCCPVHSWAGDVVVLQPSYL